MIDLGNIFGSAAVPTTPEIIDNSLLPGVHHNIPEAQYHTLPYISASFLKRFAQNPMAAIMPFTRTKNMLTGSASHAYSLEGVDAFNAGYYVSDIPCPEGQNVKGWKNTTRYKESIASIIEMNTGKEMLDADQMAAVLGMDDSLKKHPVSSKIFNRKSSEVTLIWVDEATGETCKARVDDMPGNGIVNDYKTTADVDGFVRQISNLKYFLQAGHYVNGVVATGNKADMFCFIAAQTSEPYPVRTGFISPTWLEYSRQEARRLISLVSECRKANFYPNYQIPGHIASITQIVPADLLEEWEQPKWIV
ncbi:MAG: PD-(D/E)XK nuclease-like domain-containing protein [Bacteroidales bacterium]